MNNKLKVLFVSAECDPYIKTGGLGDVAGALPAALADSGVDVRRVIPGYRSVRSIRLYETDFPVYMGSGLQTCVLKYDCQDKSIPTYFVDNDWYFNRDRPYGYYDDGERFLFFCRAVVDMLERISYIPDIIHCNDWHTGLIPLIAKAGGHRVKTIYTIHNLKYQGWITSNFLKEQEYGYAGYPEGVNFMEYAIKYCDYITTVSNGYSEEIQTPEMGEGMDALLRERKENLTGIINGIDTVRFSPDKSGSLTYPYNISNTENKAKNKALLRAELGLLEQDVPVVSAVTRLDSQKGIDILIDAINSMGMDGFQFVILGTGDKYYEDALKELERKYPGRVAVRLVFDTSLSERIYAGSDIFVMPSRYEPGGLGQLYAMAYGTVPVVRHTGGLRDTVTDILVDPERANGFTFDEYTTQALINALKNAVNTYSTPYWKGILSRGMSADRSWKRPAEEYIELYRKVLDK